jgi:phage terminase large subunit-like protein
MHVRPLSPKALKRIKKVEETRALNFEVPNNWAEFAPLTQIRSGTRVIQFEPYAYQAKLIECVESNFATVVAKTRQLGVTETVANYFLWKALRNPGYVAVVLSKGFADTSNIAKRIRVMANSLAPRGLRLESDNLTDMKILGGGRILFRPSTANGVRGLESISDILFDESAFVEGIDQIFTSAIPATEMVGDNARIIFLSTPNGKAGFYWDRLALNNGERDVEQICEDMKEGLIDPVQFWIDENKWCKFVIHWKAHPIYGNKPNYLEEIRTKKQLSETAIQQEYNLSFNESEVIVFANETVRLNTVGNYEKPVKGKRYYAGIDTSTVGDDYTVCIVLSEERGVFNVCHLYRKRKMSMDYNLEQIIDILTTYNPVKVGIEVTGGTGQIYLEQLSKRYSASKIEAIKTTGDTKPQMIDRLILALEKRAVTFPPGPITDELLSYRRTGHKLKQLEASPGKHDDTVMGLAFALTVSPFNQKGTGFNVTTIPTYVSKTES